jgi:hypothetical protein
MTEPLADRLREWARMSYGSDPELLALADEVAELEEFRADTIKDGNESDEVYGEALDRILALETALRKLIEVRLAEGPPEFLAIARAALTETDDDS